MNATEQSLIDELLPPTVEAVQQVGGNIIQNLLARGADEATATQILISALAHITGYSLAVLKAEGAWPAGDTETRKILWEAIRQSRNWHTPRVTAARKKAAN